MESELNCVISGLLFAVRYAILFDIAGGIMQFCYRRFGTTYRFYLQESKMVENYSFD